jgi:hypothetical protein
MKNKTVLIIALIALVLCMITPVNAETVTGTLGSSVSGTTTFSMSKAGESIVPDSLYVKNIQYAAPSTTTLVRFDTTRATFDANTSSGEVTPFKARLTDAAGIVLSSGSFGFARTFDNVGVELPGYQYLIFNSWDTTNLTGLTGNKIIFLEFNHTAVGNIILKSGYGAGEYPAASGDMALTRSTGSVGGCGGDYIRGYTDNSFSEYTFTKPSGLGITGSVVKFVGGVRYQSRIVISNGTPPFTPITSNSAIGYENLSLNTPAQSIIVSMFTSSGIWYNSSILFAPTVTPTPIPTWTDTDPIPSGYVRTWFENVNGQTSGQVHNSNLMLKDVENGTWRNWTNDSDGQAYIDTLPGHTLDGYGTATGFISVSRLGLPLFSNGIYELIMYPTGSFLDPGSGNINLAILVNDKTTGAAINSVTLRVFKPDGSTTIESTGSAGSVVTVVPNVSVIVVDASKSGYTSGTKTITTSSFGPDSLRIELSKSTVTVTATATPLPGQTTVAPTIDPNDPSLHDGDTSLKAQEMMNWLAMNGMDLVQLCFLVTVLALLGVKFGK